MWSGPRPAACRSIFLLRVSYRLPCRLSEVGREVASDMASTIRASMMLSDQDAFNNEYLVVRPLLLCHGSDDSKMNLVAEPGEAPSK